MINTNDPEMCDKYIHKYKQKKGIMNFIDALQLITTGSRLRRHAWTEVDFVFLVGGSEFAVNRPPLNQIFDEGTVVKYDNHIDASYQDGTIGVWTVSQRDLFANDWYIK